MARSQRRTALFYDAPLSTREDIALLKGMLLFFDDVAVFAQPDQRSRPPAIDPRLCAPLTERGLLQFVDPRSVLTAQNAVIIQATLHRAAMEHADEWLAAATAGDWDMEVPRLQGRFSAPLALNPAPSANPPAPAPPPPPPGDRRSLELFKLLAQEGLLLPDESSDDEWDIVPGTASVANSILAQAVRATARGQGWFIDPIATRRDEARVFTAILDDTIEAVRASDVVVSDLTAVTVDLTDIGLDDILDFRARHRSEFRAYLLALQALVSSGPTPPGADPTRALVDEANRLRELQRRRWTTTRAGASLGIAGAAWTLASGDLLGAMIASTESGSQLLLDRPTRVSAYTYVLRPDAEPAEWGTTPSAAGSEATPPTPPTVQRRSPLWRRRP